MEFKALGKICAAALLLVAGCAATTQDGNPGDDARDPLVGVWGGRWDGKWPAFFIVSKEEGARYHLVYKHKELADGPYQVSTRTGERKGNELVFGKIVLHLVSPLDGKRALAEGNFPIPRTASLGRLPQLPAEELDVQHLDGAASQNERPRADASNLFGLPAHEETPDKIIERSMVHVPEWKKWLVSEEHAIKNSGVIWYELSLREKDSTVSARFPALIGPYHVSSANRQIFACESNVMNDAKEAFILDMNGSVVSKIKHEGFFGDCGTTVDKRLYWLVYRDAVNEKPVTDVMIVTMQGKVIKRTRLRNKGSVQVEYEGQKYILSFPAPELPG